ncbi:protein RGF1 INDUCIBLE TRANSCRIPTION FACTOR 1-like [Zingiber officinale]|uniref:protein RGF1 INDUCIBLE TRANSCRIPTION FACTOR 1-like n=1 Tax=Zingiber officinale TaxID=94328 RepID=UPI001C4BC08A|nr:protein RGF1 INDUCIBLE TRANSCRIPTION FACTOR 1-like [Zingiber officinale]
MMMRRVAASLVPPWLETLLSTNFFSACALHTEAPRSECNMFCLDCGGAASSFCFYCRSDSHSGHRVIQIRRSSYHDVVRVAEIQKILDISGVQTYVINSARVLFLNERPQPRGGGRVAGASSSSSSPHICEICARSLLDLFRFCSLGCKLVGIKRNGDATFLLTPGDDEAAEGGGGAGGGESSTTAAADERKAGRRGRWVGGSREGAGHDIRGPEPPPPPPAASRRRKGIPHRAPFAS